MLTQQTFHRLSHLPSPPKAAFDQPSLLSSCRHPSACWDLSVDVCARAYDLEFHMRGPLRCLVQSSERWEISLQKAGTQGVQISWSASPGSRCPLSFMVWPHPSLKSVVSAPSWPKQQGNNLKERFCCDCALSWKAHTRDCLCWPGRGVWVPHEGKLLSFSSTAQGHNGHL